MLAAQQGRPTRADQLREQATSALETFGRGELPAAWQRPAPWYSLAVVPLVDAWINGSRLPLIVGPIIASAGFALFMRPGVGGSYWKTFFPAVIVLGLGLAISVAPLTTTVMNSVKQSHAGIASGVNNAVSRTAGLLSVAVLGLIMFHSFNACLDRRLDQTAVPNEIRKSLDTQRTRLAAMEIPSNNEETRAAIKQAVNECFVSGFRRVMLVGAVLGLMSSLMAGLVIRAR